MSKVNSKSTGNGSVQNSSAGGQPTTTKHQRRPRKNSHGAGGAGAGADHTQLTADVGGVDRTSLRDYAGTVASHSQATTAARRGDHQLLCPSRVFYENTYRIEPQVLVVGLSSNSITPTFTETFLRKVSVNEVTNAEYKLTEKYAFLQRETIIFTKSVDTACESSMSIKCENTVTHFVIYLPGNYNTTNLCI